MFSSEQIDLFASNLDDGFFLIGAAILVIEVLKRIFTEPKKGKPFLDMVASVSTQIPTLLFEVAIMSFAYAGLVVVAESFVTWTMPITIWTVVLALLVCDFVYYWEHRFAHEIRLFWTQHAVHHSSRYMNSAVGIRFGPFESVLSVLMHAPLVLLGFPPTLIFFGIITVLAYQAWIHTELIGKLGMLDKVLNTPSNHRVHHGCDDKYIDKNYGGILIVWDRLFGTYAAEEETPNYGLKRAFDSLNPLQVWFSELPQFIRDVRGAKTAKEALGYLFGKPGWAPERKDLSAKPNMTRSIVSARD